ncbi:MAG: cytochrome C [Alphaproteobacteria bacterium]|nr:MAG: cytochrome C [Alphaproteobacteria bacterium]
MTHFRRCILAALLALAPVALQAQDAFDLEETAGLCKTCHGEDGLPIEPNYPIIQGQQFFYLYVQLKDFKAGRRTGDKMQPVVEELTRSQLKALAQYFAKLPWPRISPPHASDEDRALAREASVKGQCGACHGKWYGDSRIPRLAGQQPGYLIKTMQDYKNDVRQNAPDKSSTMSKLTEAEIEALARTLSQLF